MLILFTGTMHWKLPATNTDSPVRLITPIRDVPVDEIDVGGRGGAELVDDARQQVLQLFGLGVAADDVRVGGDGRLHCAGRGTRRSAASAAMRQ